MELKDPKVPVMYLLKAEQDRTFLRFTCPSVFLSVHFLGVCGTQ